MTFIRTDDDEFSERALRGFCHAYAEIVRPAKGGIVRRVPPAAPKVAVVTGGGSGHYPAFAGYVGPGMADGAVVGNIFSSPPTSAIVSVARAAESGSGVLLAFGNYQGDVLNFSAAARELTLAGVPAFVLPIADDVASATADQRAQRRGIAGDLIVLKIAGAAADAGADIDEVLAVARDANARTSTLGVAFAGCTMPGRGAPQFTIPSGRMAIGLGIHGEAGIDEQEIPDVSKLAELLCDKVLADRPPDSGSAVAVVLNGLGATKYEELFVLWDCVRSNLARADLEIVTPQVGEYVTSLDMAGCSLSLCWLTDDLRPLWQAPAWTPAFRIGAIPDQGFVDVAVPQAQAEVRRWPKSDPSSISAGVTVAQALRCVAGALAEAQPLLTELDSVAGDGDHGSAMTRGASAAADMAGLAASDCAGVASVLEVAGEAWADRAGGTSGALWGLGLRAAAGSLSNLGAVTPEATVTAFEAALAAVERSGRAHLGDKTLVDALRPFVEALAAGIRSGADANDAWARAASVARDAAASTAALCPRLGRARPLAARSFGHADPGAVSFALCAEALTRQPWTEMAAQ